MAEDLRIKLKVMPDTSEVSTKIRALEQSEKLKIKVDPQFDITNIDKQTKRIYSAIANGVNKYAADIMGSIKTVIGTMDLYQGAMADVMTMLKTGNITQENYTKSLDKYNNVMTQTLALSRTFSMMNKSMQTAQREDPIYNTLRDQEKNLSALKKAAANNKAVVAEVQKDILDTLSAGDYGQAFDESQVKEAFSNITNTITSAATKSGTEIKNAIEKIKDSDAQAIADMMRDLYKQYDEDICADVFENYNGKGAKSDQAADFLRKMYASKFGDKSVFSDISKEYEVGGRLIKDTIQKLYSDIASNVELVNQTDDEDALKIYAKNISDDFNLIMTVLTSGSKDIDAEFDKVLSNIQATMYERGGEIARETVEGSAKQLGEVASGIMKGTLKQAQKEVEDDTEKMKDSVINIATEIQSGLKTAISTPAKTETDYDTGFLMYMSTYKSKIEEFSKSLKSMFSGIDVSKLDESTRQRVESVLNVMQKLDETVNDIDGSVGKKMNADIYSKFIDNIKNVSIDIDQIISDISDMTSQNLENVSFGQLTTQDIEAGNELLALMDKIIERQTSLTLAKRGTLKVETEIITAAKNEKTRLDDMVKEAMSSVKQLEAAQQGVQSNTASAKSDAEELADAMSKMEISKLKALLTTITNFVNKLTADDAKLKNVGGTLQQYKTALEDLKTGVDVYKDAISSLTKYFAGEAVVISAVSKTLNDATVVQDGKSDKDTQKNKAKSKAKTTNPVTRAKSYVKDAQAAAEQVIAALDITDETLGQIVTKLQGVAATGTQLAGSAQILDKALNQVEDASKAKIETGKKSTGKSKKNAAKTKTVEGNKIPTQQDVNKEVSQAVQQFAASIEYVLKQVVAVLDDTSALQTKVDAITAKSDTVQGDKDTIVNAFNELVTVFDSLKAAADSIQASMAGLLKLQDIADKVNMDDFADVINNAITEQLSKITSTTKAATRKAANVTGSQIANQRKNSGSIESMLGLLSNGTAKQGFQARQTELENEVAAFLSGSEKSAVVWGDIVKKTEVLKNDIKQSSDYTKRLVADGLDYANAMQALDEYTRYSETHGDQTSQNLDDKYNDLSYAIAANNDARMAMEQETTTENIVRYTQSCEARTKASSALRAALKAEEKAYNDEQAAARAAAVAQQQNSDNIRNQAAVIVGQLNTIEQNTRDTLGTKYGAIDNTSAGDALADLDELRTAISGLNGDQAALTTLLDSWRDRAASVGVAMNSLGDIVKFVSTEISAATKEGNEWNSVSESLEKEAQAQADAVDKLIAKAKKVTDARKELDLTGISDNSAVKAASKAYDDQRFITRNARSLAENHPDNAAYVKDYEDNVEKLENAFYDLASAAKTAGKQVNDVLKLSDVKTKLKDALSMNIDSGKYDEHIKGLQDDILDLLQKLNLAEQAFDSDWNIDTFKTLIDLMSQGAPLADKLSKAVRSANEKNSDNLKKQFEQLKSVQSTMTSDFGTLQQNVNNQNLSVPNGLRNTQKEVDALKAVLDEVNTTLATGDFSKLPDLFARITSSGHEVKSVSDIIDYVTSSIKNANAVIKQYGTSLENMDDNNKMFDKKLLGGSTTNGEYSDFKDSYTSKAKLDDLYAKAKAQKYKVDKAKRDLTTNNSIENIKNYNKEVEKLTALVSQLRKEMQTVKFGDADFLSGQFADKEKTIATLKSLLDKFNSDVGAAGGLSSSKAFAGDLQYIINELDKLGTASDLGNLFKSTGTEFDNIRSKAYSTGESFDTLASMVSYFRKAMAEANSEAKKYNDAQSKIGKEHESFNDAKTEEKYANRNDLFAEYANYAKSHTPTKQLQDMESEYVSLVNKVNNARKALKANWSTENLETYLSLLDQMYNKGEAVRKQLKSVEYSEDESLRKQYSNVNSKITEIDRAMSTYKNALGNARDKGFDDSAFMRLMNGDTSTGYVGIREALKNVVDSGDYTQLTGVFQQFANELSESGTAAKNLAEFMALVSRKINQAKQSAKEFNDEQQAKLNENSWGKSMQNTMYTAERYFKNNSAISKNMEAYAKFTDFFNSWKPKIESKEFTKDNANEMSKAWSSLKKEIQDAGLETDTLAVKLKKLFEVNIKSQLANQVINAFQQGLRQVYQNVVDIDSAMTELKKVTDETSARYSQFMENAGTRAKDLGTSITNVINSTADFARLGYNIDEAEKVSDAALMLKNVGDGISSIDDASSMVISSMQAFGVETNDVMRIVNEYNTAGNKFAISADGVGQAINRSGAALKSANNTLEESIALATAMNRVVQNPETVGRFAQQRSNTLIEYIYIGQTPMNILGQDRGKTLQIRILPLCG